MVTLSIWELYIYAAVLILVWTISLSLADPHEGDSGQWLTLVLLCIVWPIGLLITWIYTFLARQK